MFKTKFAAAVAAVSVAILSPAVAHAAPVAVNPGDQIEIQFSNRKVSLCSLTSVVKDKKGDLYGVTAAHCVKKRDGGSTVKKVSAKGSVISDNDFMSHYDYNPDFYHHDFDSDVLNDTAMFKLASGVATNGLIGGNTPVGNVASINDISQGDAVCKYGRSTQKTCGKVTKVERNNGKVEASVYAIGGDSGSPIYTVDSDGVAHIIASLTGGYAGNDDINFGDEVAGDFSQWGVEIVGKNDALTVPPTPFTPQTPSPAPSSLSSFTIPMSSSSF